MSSDKFDKVKYKNSFIAENYDRINLTVPKGRKLLLKKHADAHEISLNSYINEAINDKLRKDLAEGVVKIENREDKK